MGVVFWVTFYLFVLDLLGFGWVGMVSERGCGDSLFCCGSWGDFEGEFRQGIVRFCPKMCVE